MTGCEKREDCVVPQALVEADSLLRIEEDSAAWEILKAVNGSEFEGCEEVTALYDVLTVQAEDRNDMQLDTTLIAEAIEYYSRNEGDKYHAGLAWYYGGHKALKEKKYEVALMRYIIASKLSDEGLNLRYAYLSRNYQSLIYGQFNEDRTRKDVLLKAASIAQKIGNNNYLSITLPTLAKCYRRLGQIDSSLYYLNQVSNLPMSAKRKAFLMEQYALCYLRNDSIVKVRTCIDSLNELQKTDTSVAPHMRMLFSAKIANYEGKLETAMAILDSLQDVNSLDVQVGRERLYRDVLNAMREYDAANKHANALYAIEGKSNRMSKHINDEARRLLQENDLERQRQEGTHTYEPLLALAAMTMLLLSVGFMLLRNKKDGRKAVIIDNEEHVEGAIQSEKAALCAESKTATIDVEIKRKIASLVNNSIITKDNRDVITNTVSELIDRGIGKGKITVIRDELGLSDVLAFGCILKIMGVSGKCIGNLLNRSSSWLTTTVDRKADEMGLTRNEFYLVVERILCG